MGTKEWRLPGAEQIQSNAGGELPVVRHASASAGRLATPARNQELSARQRDQQTAGAVCADPDAAAHGFQAIVLPLISHDLTVGGSSASPLADRVVGLAVDTLLVEPRPDSADCPDCEPLEPRRSASLSDGSLAGDDRPALVPVDRATGDAVTVFAAIAAGEQFVGAILAEVAAFNARAAGDRSP